MPVVLKIDRQRKVVYSSFYGKITDKELLSHRERIAAEPEFNSGFDEIADFTGVVQADISEAVLAAIANSPSLYSEKSLHIIVAPEALSFQFANKFKVIAEGKRRNLFVVRSRADAYKLLDGK